MSPFYSRHTERRYALFLCKIRQIIHDYLTSLLKEINSKDQKKLALPMISNDQDSTVFDTNKIKKANEEKRNNKNYTYHSKKLIFPLNIFEKFLKRNTFIESNTLLLTRSLHLSNDHPAECCLACESPHTFYP